MKRTTIGTMVLLLLVGLIGSPTFAAKVPDPGSTDHRVRQVDYNPLQVYKITGYYGYALTVLFERNETIQQVVLGDPDGWEHEINGFVLSLKPKAREPDTSMVVLTNHREYVFDLRAKNPRRGSGAQAMDKDQAFLVRFRYPEMQAAREAASQAQIRAQAEAKEMQNQRLEAERQLVAHMPSKPINRNYTVSGSKELAPMEMWDDGQFTYLRFSAQQGIPAIYTVAGDGSEIIASKHFEQDVTVVQKLSRKLVLRRGLLVACLWNEGPELRTQQPSNGSSDPASARLKKPVAQPSKRKPFIAAPQPTRRSQTRYPAPSPKTEPPLVKDLNVKDPIVKDPNVSASQNDSLLLPKRPVVPKKRPARQPKVTPKGTAATSASNARKRKAPTAVATPVRAPKTTMTTTTTKVVPVRVSPKTFKPATFSTVE
jgi:type IV secretion system protein VirB9